jgi:hypothetical protein
MPSRKEVLTVDANALPAFGWVHVIEPQHARSPQSVRGVDLAFERTWLVASKANDLFNLNEDLHI